MSDSGRGPGWVPPWLFLNQAAPIGCQFAVVRHERDVQCQALRHEHPVERIPVVERQVLQCPRTFGIELLGLMQRLQQDMGI